MTSFHPKKSFLLFEIVQLKFILNPSSCVPFPGFITSIKKGFHNFLDELTLDNITLDIKALLFNVLIAQAEKKLSQRISNMLMPSRDLETYLLGSELTPVPTIPYMSIKIGSGLFSRALFYPFTTLIIRYIDQQISFKDIPSLFTNACSFKNLYKGFGYNMLWSIGHFKICCLIDYLTYKFTQEENPGGIGISIFFLELSRLLLVPFRVKGVLDQANITHDFTFRLTWYQYSSGFLLNHIAR